MKRALFLDRDGVINKDINYLHRIEDVEFTNGIFEVCRYFFEKKYIIVVITNQAGIGRGYYTEADFYKLTDWMSAQFKTNGLEIAATYFCPYHPTAGVGSYKRRSLDRKPNPGMLLKARDELHINLGESILVGDKESDIEAGKRAGVGTTILFWNETGPTPATQAEFVITELTDLISNQDML